MIIGHDVMTNSKRSKSNVSSSEQSAYPRGRGRAPLENAAPRVPNLITGPNEIDRYIDRLLDAALEETFPAHDAVAIPMRHEP
jgi:hypothetical protein